MADLLLENGEFLDESFSPSLRQIGWNSYRNFLRSWKFQDFGVPAPTLSGDSAAYWLASVRNKHNELPVLVVTKSAEQETVESSTKNWFAGIISVDYVAELSDDPMELHRACLEVAMSGPTYFNHAIEYFNYLCPADQIILPDSVDQFKKPVYK